MRKCFPLPGTFLGTTTGRPFCLGPVGWIDPIICIFLIKFKSLSDSIAKFDGISNESRKFWPDFEELMSETSELARGSTSGDAIALYLTSSATLGWQMVSGFLCPRIQKGKQLFFYPAPLLQKMVTQHEWTDLEKLMSWDDLNFLRTHRHLKLNGMRVVV